MRKIKRINSNNQNRSGKTSKIGKARMDLRTAVRSGKIKKPDHCEKCGKKCNPNGHHYKGYDYPLTVQWLCDDCHMELHKKK